MFFHVGPADEERRPVDRATVRRVVGTFKPYKGKVGVVGLLIAVLSSVLVRYVMLTRLRTVRLEASTAALAEKNRTVESSFSAAVSGVATWAAP